VTLNASSRAREQRFIRDFERAASAASRPLVLASAHRARGRSPPAPPPPGGGGGGSAGVACCDVGASPREDRPS